MAEAADGTLWIASDTGLYNFNGHTFTALETLPDEPRLPAEPVYSICVAKDGSLWLGFLQAGAARIYGGRVQLYPNADEDSLGQMQHLQQAADGSIWGLSNKISIVRFGADLAWHREKLPGSPVRINRFFIDSSNTLWVPQQGRYMLKRPLAQTAYSVTEIPTGLTFGFAETGDGSIWISDVIAELDQGRMQRFDRLGRLVTRMPAYIDSAHDILHAADGSLIVATQGSGLHRFPARDLAAMLQTNQPIIPNSSVAGEGLTADEARDLLLDADGNIWAATRRGLDRFRKAQLIRFVPKKSSTHWGICANDKSALWIAGVNDQLYKLSGDTILPFPEAQAYRSLFCGSDGDVWLTSGPFGIWRLHSNRFEPIPFVPNAPPYSVVDVVATSDHTLYAILGRSAGGGVWRYKNSEWTKLALTGGPSQSAWEMYVDSHDRLWLGHRDGTISLPLEHRSFSSGDPGLGFVNAVLETSHGIFATGSNGVALLRNDRFEMLAFANRSSVNGVSGIVESRNGDLWLSAARGIVRISAGEVQNALIHPQHPMNIDFLTEGDFVGGPQDDSSFQTAARDDEDNLWFVTVNGVIHLDSANWRAKRSPPFVSIKSIKMDNKEIAGAANIGPRPQALEVRYLGVNLSAPEQVIYKYRLDGFDDEWQEVGSRTEAIYTRLPAGTYTFSVAASNGDGAWTPAVSTAAFTVLPSFYQTTWFAVTCLCAALVIVWLAFRIRVRAITRVVRARAEERADERIRIARDLHDTLLQSIQGLLLTLHVATQKISHSDESRSMLEKALTSADSVIIEGRNRVSNLRSEHLSDAELVASLKNVCNDLRHNDNVQCEINRSGGVPALHAHVADEIFFVAREALTNAFRHSQARHISLNLNYGKRFFTLECKDDGRGFEPEEQDKAGHWGLKGMAERAQKLGGRMRCRSNPGHGTEVLVSIPAYEAYPKHSRIMFYLRALALPERNPLTE